MGKKFITFIKFYLQSGHYYGMIICVEALLVRKAVSNNDSHCWR